MKKTSSAARVEPVRKSITVRWDPAAAFRRFTEEIADWWPLKTHSVGEERAESVVFEARRGGQLYEIIQGGERSVWGTVTECDPPYRIVFTWHPGRDPDGAQLVELRFSAAEGGTRVDLVHSGWEALGDEGQKMRDGYDTGWDRVLELYAG